MQNEPSRNRSVTNRPGIDQCVLVVGCTRRSVDGDGSHPASFFSLVDGRVYVTSDRTTGGSVSEDYGSHAGTHHVYVIECADGTLYTGYTTDVERRVSEHDAGEGAKYTRGRTPVTLRHVESFASKSTAMSREYAIKSLTRTEKLALLEAE